MKVKTLKAQFKKEFGLSIRIYDGRSSADENSTLASIRKGLAKSSQISPRRNTKIGNFEGKIKEIFALKVQVAGSDDSYLCANDHTLAKALEVDKKRVSRKQKIKSTIMTENHFNKSIPVKERVQFDVEQCGELGFGEIKGNDLKSFIMLLEQKKMGDSDFVYDPFKYAEFNAAGIFASKEDLPNFSIDNLKLTTDGKIGFPVSQNGVYKDGYFLLYAIISDKYTVELDLNNNANVVFSGPEIDLAGIEPDLQVGDVDGFTLVHDIEIDGKSEKILDFMVDFGLRQIVKVVCVEHGNVDEIYVNNGKNEDYFNQEPINIKKNIGEKMTEIESCEIIDFYKTKQDVKRGELVIDSAIPSMQIKIYNGELFEISSIDGLGLVDEEKAKQTLEELSKDVFDLSMESVTGNFLLGLIESTRYVDPDEEAISDALNDRWKKIDFIEDSKEFDNDYPIGTVGCQILNIGFVDEPGTITVDNGKVVTAISGYDDFEHFARENEDEVVLITSVIVDD